MSDWGRVVPAGCVQFFTFLTNILLQSYAMHHLMHVVGYVRFVTRHFVLPPNIYRFSTVTLHPLYLKNLCRGRVLQSRREILGDARLLHLRWDS